MMNKISQLLLLIPFFLLPSIKADEKLHSKHNQKLLSPLQEVLQSSSISITNENRVSIGYGCLMSAEGHVFTKASLITDDTEKILIRHGGKEYEATLLEKSKEWDVALLKFALKGGDPLTFKAAPSESGQIVVTNGVTSLLKRHLKFGVVAANTRPIPFQESALDLRAAPSGQSSFCWN